MDKKRKLKIGSKGKIQKFKCPNPDFLNLKPVFFTWIFHLFRDAETPVCQECGQEVRHDETT